MSDGFDAERSQRAVEALLAPRNIAIVGANDRPGSWPARTWQNLKEYGFPGAVYPVNPRRAEIWDVPCYASLADLPEPPDHLAILVPPAAVIGVLEGGARAGARSATIFTSGIGDATAPGGMQLGIDVTQAIRTSGLAVSGPNCMGNFCARTRMATLNDPGALPPGPGPVAMVGQSGGVMLFTAHALRDRGIGVGYIVTSGNEIGLTSADYIAAYSADPGVKVIVVYVEGVRNANAFRDACAVARAAGKRVVVLKMGRFAAGREAALAHTGAVAGRADVFDAIVGEHGAIRVDTADDVVETVELLLHAPALQGRRLAALTLSGAFRGMLLDAAEEHGLIFPPLAAATTDRLNALLSAGAMVGNPVDGGFGILTSAETYRSCIEVLEADPNVDILIVQEELAREPGPGRSERWMMIAEEIAAARAAKPIVYASFVSYGLSAHSLELRARLPHIAVLQELSRALRAIAKTVRAAEMAAMAGRAAAAPAPAGGAPTEPAHVIALDGGIPLILSIYRDPEMGVVVMAASGGDSACAAPPISREKANDLIERLRIGRTITTERESAIGTLAALGRLASET